MGATGKLAIIFWWGDAALKAQQRNSGIQNSTIRKTLPFRNHCPHELDFQDCTLSIRKLFIAPVIPAVVDKLLSRFKIRLRTLPGILLLTKEEPRTMQMYIRHMQLHRPPLRNVPRLV